MLDLATSVVPYVALTAVGYLLLDVSYLLVLALAVPTAGFLFAKWKHNHAVHHATNGDLDRRGVGDVLTLTVAEYGASW